MRRTVAAILLFGLLANCAIASPGPSKTKSKRATKRGPSVSEQIQKMQDQLKQQQDQIQQQQNQINQLQQQLQQSSSQVESVQQQNQQMQNSLQQVTTQASTTAESTQNLTTAVSDLKTNTTTVSQNLSETQKTVKELENPPAIHYKGITITPGGFISSDFLVRSRNENADVISSFGNPPFGGTANANLSEFRATARASRLFVLAEGKVGSTKLSGYYEIDFLGQAPTANQIQTNSFTPRQRQLWAQADFSNGFTVTAGQFWSLITTDRKGIATRAEFIPNTIEGSYVVGYNYVRQNAVRVVKNFNDKVWIAGEVANAETTVNTSFTPPDIQGLNNSPNALSPNGVTLNFLAGSTNGFSTNLAPDLLAKVAFEPGWGHYEIKAVGRFFRDRIASTATSTGHTNTTFGGGVGAAAILPIVPKKVDLIAEGLWGPGVGRYGAAAGADVTIRPSDGALVPIKAGHAMGGLEFHPSAKLDVYLYGGTEYYSRTSYVSPTGGPAGYGSFRVNNTNCQVEVVPTGGAACGAQNKNVYEGTAGFWYRLYRGNYGTFQYGLQYEYLHRTAWAGTGGTPKGLDNIFMTSFRYYIP